MSHPLLYKRAIFVVDRTNDKSHSDTRKIYKTLITFTRETGKYLMSDERVLDIGACRENGDKDLIYRWDKENNKRFLKNGDTLDMLSFEYNKYWNKGVNFYLLPYTSENLMPDVSHETLSQLTIGDMDLTDVQKDKIKSYKEIIGDISPIYNIKLFDTDKKFHNTYKECIEFLKNEFNVSNAYKLNDSLIGLDKQGNDYLLPLSFGFKVVDNGISENKIKHNDNKNNIYYHIWLFENKLFFTY